VRLKIIGTRVDATEIVSLLPSYKLFYRESSNFHVLFHCLEFQV